LHCPKLGKKDTKLRRRKAAAKKAVEVKKAAAGKVPGVRKAAGGKKRPGPKAAAAERKVPGAANAPEVKRVELQEKRKYISTTLKTGL
jgi:hypothetical protein